MTGPEAPGAGTGLSDDIVAWVEKCADGRVVHADRRPGGGRREAWVVDVEGADGVRPLFLRYDRSDPAVTGDPFTLHREAQFYLALQDSPVPVPRVLGVHETEQAILSERVAGETWFSRLRDEEQRVAVARDFMRILASLHRLDPSVLSIPGEPQPADLREAVTSDLDRWETLYRFDGVPDDPMIEFGLQWLRANQPAGDGPVVIVQGDTGPGNFLYADGRVTAVLDWELAHWGDPMDDLGWLALRAVQEPFTSLPERLGDWEEHSGLKVDVDRVRYYRVLAELKVVILGHRRAEGQNLLGEVGNGLIYGQLHRRLFVEAMADVLGVDLDLPAEIEAPPTEVGWLYDAAMAQIREIIVPRSTDPFVVMRAKGLARILKHLQQVDRLGAIAAAGELADLRAVTGADVATVEEGRAQLAAAVRAGRVSTQDALRYFAHRAARGTQLLRPAMGVLADRHFDPLT